VSETEHTFTVTVATDVAIPDGDQYGRTVAGYAQQALLCASLPEAARLDGFADLEGDIRIVDVAES
jgi:hypothetical protein